MRCWLDGCDNLAMKERGELQLQFQTKDRNFYLSVTVIRFFELSGLRMVEKEVWWLQRQSQRHL